jgi:formyltetrahydrofolate deformylase
MDKPARDVPTYILTIICPDRTGIVAAVSEFLAARRCNIVDVQQYSDPLSRQLFMRLAFTAAEASPDRAALSDEFTHIGRRFDMHWELHDAGRRQRLLLMVSRLGHCLSDILFRYRAGILPIDIPAIVSNHRTYEEEARFYGIPFHYLPVTATTKAEQEAKLWEIVQSERVDLVVLARYMQVLSADMCDRLKGRCINIHHSFLPSFKGAGPYRQAYERGVKVIGATAHYVTADLDEGPIIDQDVEAVDHTKGPETLAAIGRDIERKVLLRAVEAHIEHRIIVNGVRTIVFR